MNFCNQCGHKVLNLDALFCQNCGCKLLHASEQSQLSIASDNTPQLSLFQKIARSFCKIPRFGVLVISVMMLIPLIVLPITGRDTLLFLWAGSHRTILLVMIFIILCRNSFHKYILLTYFLLLAWDFSSWVLQVEIESIGRRANDYITPDISITYLSVFLTTIAGIIISIILMWMINSRPRIVAILTSTSIGIHLIFKMSMWSKHLDGPTIDTSILRHGLLVDLHLFEMSFSFFAIVMITILYVRDVRKQNR